MNKKNEKTDKKKELNKVEEKKSTVVKRKRKLKKYNFRNSLRVFNF